MLAAVFRATLASWEQNFTDHTVRMILHQFWEDNSKVNNTAALSVLIFAKMAAIILATALTSDFLIYGHLYILSRNLL